MSMRKIIGIIVLIGIVITIILFYGTEVVVKEPKPIRKNKDFITIYASSYNKDVEENKIYRSLEELEKDFGYTTLLKDDFEKHNYLLVKTKVDRCSEKNITPTDYRVKDNHYTVTITYDSICGLCASEYMYFLLEVGKDVDEATVEVIYKTNSKEECDPNVIY